MNRTNTSIRNPRPASQVRSGSTRHISTPVSEPQHPQFAQHMKENPEVMIGMTVLSSALKYVDNTPEWVRPPERWSHGTVQDVDEDDEWYVRKDDVVMGKVTDFEDGSFTITHEDIETEEITTRTVSLSMMWKQLGDERWWAEKTF